jgi:hypothetical protein
MRVLYSSLPNAQGAHFNAFYTTRSVRDAVVGGRVARNFLFDFRATIHVISDRFA